MTDFPESPSDPGPVPDDVVAIAERITGSADAPAAYRELHRRIREGHTSWQEWWIDPESAEHGSRLLREVVTAQLAEVRELMDLPPRDDAESD